MRKENKYKLIVSESQLKLIAKCVEDMSRFMSGQTELWNSTSILDSYCDLRDKLEELKPLVTPELPHNASYGWNGGHCPNKYQEEFIAKTYAIYREILHQMRVLNRESEKDGEFSYNVYDSPTLTCKLGGELPKIEKIEE